MRVSDETLEAASKAAWNWRDDLCDWDEAKPEAQKEATREQVAAAFDAAGIRRYALVPIDRAPGDIRPWEWYTCDRETAESILEIIQELNGHVSDNYGDRFVEYEIRDE